LQQLDQAPGWPCAAQRHDARQLKEIPMLCLIICGLVLLAPLSAAELPTDPSKRGQVLQQQAFEAYWYHRGAEITRYRLRQSRYGAERLGDAVLIFVTEPFSRDQQVKSDDPDAADAAPVLKLNHTRQFVTGLYPYHVMSSGFMSWDPADAGVLFKHTTTVQEWCGHVFEQWNRRHGAWRYRLFSYFQSEGDQDRSLAGHQLEDGLWLQLRLNPDVITSGEQILIPGALTRRFQHRSIAPARASISHVSDAETGLRQLVVQYSDIDRELRIAYRPGMPWTIEGWQEREGDAVTTAVKTHRIMDPYWQHNRLEDETRRADLGLK